MTQDVLFAVRVLWKRRQSTLLMVVVLALAIGASATALSAAKVWIIRPFTVPAPERLVMVEARHLRKDSGAHYPDFLDWRRRNRVFEDIAIFLRHKAVFTGGPETERVDAFVTTSGALRVLGVTPAIGRFFTEQEDSPGGVRVALISRTAWQNRFAGRADILGAVAILNGNAHTIIGVMPDSVVLPWMPRAEFWLPLRENPAGPRVGQQYYYLLARLRPGTTLTEAQADLSGIARALEREYPASNEGWGVVLLPAESVVRGRAIVPLAVFATIAAALLVLVLANVAGVLLARASERTRELAIRMAIGASRWRIVRQLLTESVLLAVCAGAFGLLVANGLVHVAASLEPQRGLDTSLRPDALVLLATFALSVLTGLACGLSPALRYRKTDIDAALKGLHASDGRRHRARFLSALVVTQIALSAALLVGGGLLARDFLRLLTVDTGVKPDGVITARVEFPRRRYASAQQKTDVTRQIVDRLRATPGIHSAAAVAALPMSGYKTGGRFELVRDTGEILAADATAVLNEVTPGYFATLGIPLLQGRDFDERDRPGSPAVVVVNERLARRYFPDGTAIGGRIALPDGVHTVVGVAGAVRHEGPWRPAAPEIYFPLARSPRADVFFVARSTLARADLIAAFKQRVREFDPALFVDQLRPMDRVVQDSLAQPRLLARGLLGVAGIGLLLAVLGLYGVVAYATAQRTREIAIRVAVGATPAQVLRSVLRQGLSLAGLGIAVGLPLAFGLAEVVEKFLAMTSTHDVAVFGGVAVGLLVVAAAATYIPASRAARIEPLVVLRSE